LLALKLFELGRLSAGKAAELSGLTKPQFLRKASDLGVPVVRLDPDQLNGEFANA
jgi:predicted HTH domain antitoxin